MLLDLFDREPLLNILVQHFHDQVLELKGQFARAISVPEPAGIAVQGTVVQVVALGRLKGQEAGRHNEQNHSRGKNVSGLSVELLVILDFWAHVALSSNFPSDWVCAFHAESEISDLQGVVLIKQKIFGLDIQVRHSAVVHELDGIDELVEVRPGHSLAEPVAQLYQFVDLLVGGILHDQDFTVGSPAVGVVFGQPPVLVVADYVGVVQIVSVVKFRFREFGGFGLENLDGIFEALAFGLIDLGTVACADLAKDGELVDGRWVNTAHFQGFQLLLFWNCSELQFIQERLIKPKHLHFHPTLHLARDFSQLYNLMIVRRLTRLFGSRFRAFSSGKNTPNSPINHSEFQKEFGLDKELQALHRKQSRRELLTEWAIGLPLALIAGFSLFYVISADEEDSNNMKLWFRLQKRRLKASIFSTPAVHRQLLDAMYDYAVNSTGKAVLLQDIYLYIDRNQLSEEDLPKVEAIVLRTYELVCQKPTSFTLGLVQSILTQGLKKDKRLLELKYNDKLAGLCLNFGNLEQQFVGLLIIPNHDINEAFVSRFNSNLNLLSKMLYVDLESIKFKCHLYKHYTAFIINKISKCKPSALKTLSISSKLKGFLLKN